MYTITKQFAFEAAHRLTGLHPAHPCMRLHGHSYRVELVLQSTRLNEHGFVVDYRELGALGDYIADLLDHRNVDDWMVDHGGGQSTAENIARELFNVVVERGWSFADALAAVRVSETAKTWAEYRP